MSLTPGSAGATAGTNNPIVKISPLFEALLSSSHGLLTRVHQPSAAVLVAQTAIEVCTERLVSKLLDKRGTKFLEDWIDARLRKNYNIANETVSGLYEALSQDTQIRQQAFWQRLQSHAQLRNKIAHQGRIATEDEAQASITVAREVIGYLTGIATQHAIDLAA